MSEETEYQTLLREAYQGEVFGDAFFGALADKQPDPDRREKLKTLQTVEARTAQTLRRLAAPAKVLGGENEARAEGEKLAGAIDPEDWHSFVTGLRDGLPPFLANFERLRDIATTPTDPALTALVNHEKAIAQFADLEATGQGDRALKPLMDHLRKPA
jgi:hypothetical protein